VLEELLKKLCTFNTRAPCREASEAKLKCVQNSAASDEGLQEETTEKAGGPPTFEQTFCFKAGFTVDNHFPTVHSTSGCISIPRPKNEHTSLFLCPPVLKCVGLASTRFCSCGQESLPELLGS
jgi:hypothetical protein